MFTTAGFDSSINLDRRPEIVLKLLTTGFNIDIPEVVLLGTMLPCTGFDIPEVALLPCTDLMNQKYRCYLVLELSYCSFC
mgnify:CR=1 FL=1